MKQCVLLEYEMKALEELVLKCSFMVVEMEEKFPGDEGISGFVQSVKKARVAIGLPAIPSKEGLGREVPKSWNL